MTYHKMKKNVTYMESSQHGVRGREIRLMRGERSGMPGL